MIKAESISKKYITGRRSIEVLKGISLGIEKGECVAVKGRSGSGKTTLLNCLAGIEKPDNGCIFYGSEDITGFSTGKTASFLRTNTGYIFQNNNLVSYLNVFENIAFPLSLNGIFGSEAKRRVRKFLEITDLKEAERALPQELSGGEALRVAVARALVHEPKIVFADEPTSSLDTGMAGVVIDLLTETAKSLNCAVIFSTHDSMILDRADRIIELEDGRIL